MKKNLFSLALIGIATFGLAACGTTGYSDEAKATYLDRAVNNAAICASNGGGAAYSQTETNQLDGEDMTSIRVAKYLMVRDRTISDEYVTVNFTWSYDDTYANLVKTFGDVTNSDGTISHQVLEFDYDQVQAGQTADFVLKGQASFEGSTQDFQYAFTLSAPLIYESQTLAELYSLNDDGQYSFVGKSNNGTSYYYIRTRGYVIGTSPDGNFGMIADGEHYMQIYSGSESNLSSATFPALTVGNLVEVRGSVSSYYGNVQLSYISAIDAVTDETVAQPSGEWAITETEWNNLYQYDGNQNRAVTITGVYAGNLKNQSGSAIAEFTPDQRCTFEVTFGSTTITVAYNYHVNRNSSGIGDEYASYLNGAIKVGDAIKVSGFMLCNDGQNSGWITPDESGISYNSSGERVGYEIMPFDSGDIARG